MSKGSIITLAVVGVIVAIAIWLVSLVVSTSNREVTLRATIEQKQKDNQSEYDNMWKKISQVAQVTDAQKNALKEIFEGYAKARSGGGDDKLVMKWLQESVPHVDTSTFTTLQNVITGSRDAFTFRQKELLDLKREHDIILRRFPEGVILSMFGRKPIDVTIVTSSRSEEVFKTGKDDDVDVFKK